MKRISLLLASVAFATPAFAADIIYSEPPAPAPMPVVEVAPAYTWSGFYVGAQAGVAFSGDDESDINFDPGDDGVFNDDDDFFNDDDDDNNAGFVGGAHIGYDQQFGNFVLGGIADINFIDAETNRSYSFDFDDDDTTDAFAFGVNDEIDYLGTVRARAGIAFDRVLVYGTGGLSYAGFDREMNIPDGATIDGVTYEFEEDGDEADFGYNIGAGVDVLATENLSFGVEYLYHNLGENEFDVEAVEVGGDGSEDFSLISNDDDLDFHTVWARASYRFN